MQRREKKKRERRNQDERICHEGSGSKGQFGGEWGGEGGVAGDGCWG